MTRVISIDLDETLISSRWYPVSYREPDFTMFHDRYSVYKRPHVEDFLNWAYDNFDKVGVSTTADTAYAEIVVENVFGDRKLDFLFTYRDVVAPPEGQPHIYSMGHRTYIKDVPKILKTTGTTLDRLVIVDDKLTVYDRRTVTQGTVFLVSPYHLDQDQEHYPDELLNAKQSISSVLEKW